jgi:TonB family protein
LHKSFAPTQAPTEWQRYTIKGEEFSVLLPTAPAMATYELRKDPFSKGRIRYIIGAYSQGVVYAIYVAERKQSLDEYIGQSRYSSPNESKREVKVGDFTGKEYAFQDSDIKRVTQYFITKRYLYSFIAQGSYLGNPDRDIPRFLGSIKFQPEGNDLAIVDGPGEQPAIDATATTAGSDARIVSGRETTTRARVITKPEPTYTEAARKNQVTGTVVLRCVFTSSGTVTNIRATSELPQGLTEQAIASAKQIRFLPAIKDGHFVSMYIQLEYNFNLY